MIGIDDLLKAGYIRNMANFFSKQTLTEDEMPCYDPDFRSWAHAHGFSARHASYLDLKNYKIEDYLSDFDYNLLSPINDWGRIWVNDKLSLKLVLHGTAFSHLMPDYYYYMSRNGLCSLVDNEHGNTLEDFLAALRHYGIFACKPNNGAFSEGFAKLSYANDTYFINNEAADAQEVVQFVLEHPNYLYTEYLFAGPQFSAFSPIINTLRINTLNTACNNPEIINVWMRIPANTASISNRIAVKEETDYNFVVKVNKDTGKLEQAKLMGTNKAEPVDTHPSSGLPYQLTIDNWGQLIEDILGICRYLGPLEWLGFDIGISHKGFKMMEINTWPGITYMQAFEPLMLHPSAGPFFQKKLRLIKELTPEQKRQRNNIPR